MIIILQSTDSGIMSFSLIINDFKKVGNKGEDVSHGPSRRIYFFKHIMKIVHHGN